MGATEEMKMKKDGWCQSGRISSSGLVATSEQIHNRADRFNAAAPSRIHTHTGHWLHTGWKRPSPWLWKKCRCFVCSSKWEPECVRWTLDGCVMLVVARAGLCSILVLCGGQRAAAVMVDTSYNNYSTGAGPEHWAIETPSANRSRVPVSLSLSLRTATLMNESPGWWDGAEMGKLLQETRFLF